MADEKLDFDEIGAIQRNFLRQDAKRRKEERNRGIPGLVKQVAKKGMQVGAVAVISGAAIGGTQIAVNKFDEAQKEAAAVSAKAGESFVASGGKIPSGRIRGEVQIENIPVKIVESTPTPNPEKPR